MERIKKVTLFCIKNSSILIPVIIIEVVIIFINQFGNYDSNEINLFDFFSDPFENSDKFYTSFISLSNIIIDYIKHTFLSNMLVILNFLLEETIILGMVYLSLKKGFTTISDFWTALKKYTWKVILVYLLFYIILVLFITGFLLLMLKQIEFIGDFEILIFFSMSGAALFLIFFLLFLTYTIPYAVYSCMEQKNIISALGRFFKDTSKCWFRIFPVMLVLDILDIILKTVFTNLDFLFLLDTLNTCIINTSILYFQTVWMLSVLYSVKIPDDISSADELIVIKVRKQRHNIGRAMYRSYNDGK